MTRGRNIFLPVTVLVQMGYKLYNPKANKFIVNRDVEFVEDESWEWSVEEIKYMSFILDEDLVAEDSELVTKPQSPSPVQPAPCHSSTHTRVMPAEFENYILTNCSDVYDEGLINFALYANSDPEGKKI